MTTERLSFKGGNPGAVQYGNFINYYSFHSPMERVQNLSSDMFPAVTDSAVVCLDIGCNTGDLTRELKMFLSSVYPNKHIYIIGVDIDPILIERANETKCEGVSFETMDIMNDDGIERLKLYLKSFDKSSFDIVFSFSVTMWIHLNNGDKGLFDYINIVKNIGQTLILEPQPWRCYRSAYKRMKKYNYEFPLFDSLKVRESVEEIIVKEIVKDRAYTVTESPLSTWNRKILSFKEPQI